MKEIIEKLIADEKLMAEINILVNRRYTYTSTQHREDKRNFIVKLYVASLLETLGAKGYRVTRGAEESE